MPHFFGFHAISRVFVQFCEIYIKLGHIYSQKNDGRVQRTMFSTPADMSNMGSQGVQYLVIHWDKITRSPHGNQILFLMAVLDSYQRGFTIFENKYQKLTIAAI